MSHMSCEVLHSIIVEGLASNRHVLKHGYSCIRTELKHCKYYIVQKNKCMINQNGSKVCVNVILPSQSDKP